MKKYKLNINRDLLEVYSNVICDVLKDQAIDLNEMLLYCQLADFKVRIDQLLAGFKHRFNISLKPSEAISLVLLYQNYLQTSANTYSNMMIKQITNNLIQQLN